MLSVHTSPLEQPGTGDAGGMNVYVLELSRALAARGARVEIFTRATSSDQAGDRRAARVPTPTAAPLRRRDEARDVLLADDVDAGRRRRRSWCTTCRPARSSGSTRTTCPACCAAWPPGVLRSEAARRPGWYDVVHSHYWLSGQVGAIAADRWEVPARAHRAHPGARQERVARPR